MEKFKRISTYEDGGRMYIEAKDQTWSNKTAQDELLSLNVVFKSCGVSPIRILPRQNSNPLLQIGSEDDGRICFSKTDQIFDAFWANSLISDLQTALKIIQERGDMKFTGRI